MRARLERIGVYRESGHEHFNGSLIVPVMDETGAVQEVYGRKIRDDLRPGTPKHLYLPGPHRGVWNIEGVAGGHSAQGGGEVIASQAAAAWGLAAAMMFAPVAFLGAALIQFTCPRR